MRLNPFRSTPKTVQAPVEPARKKSSAAPQIELTPLTQSQFGSINHLLTENHNTQFDSIGDFAPDTRTPSQKLDDEWAQKVGARRAGFDAQKMLNGTKTSIKEVLVRARQHKQRNTNLPNVAGPAHLTVHGEQLHDADIQAMGEAFELLHQMALQDPENPAHQPLLENHAHLAGQIAIVRQALAAKQNTVTDENPDTEEIEHGHGGGAIVVDVDEAIHGLYAAISYMVQAIKGGGAQVTQQFANDAHLLATSPLGWVHDQGVPHGITDFGMSVGVGGALIPFSLLAMKAGVEEMQGAYHEHKRLNKIMDQLQTQAKKFSHLAMPKKAANFDTAEGAAAAQSSNLVDVQQAHTQMQIDELNFSKKQNKDGGMIGVFSLSSGAAIASKVGLDIGTKSAFIATSAAAGPAAATAAAGVASTFALGPLAAVSAMGLGGYMVHKSAAKAKAFTDEKTKTMEPIEAMDADVKSSANLNNYSDFLGQKLDQHEHFYNNYRDWNKGFLAGSGIYTAGTLAKVGVVIAVSAGAIAVAEPATLGTIIGLGALGGAIMGASSHQFLSGHGRHHRYEQYYKDDDVELNRHFLASADLLCMSKPGADELQGYKLRAGFHQQIYDREDLRQDFLGDVAEEKGKKFSGQYTYTADTADTREKRGEKPNRKQMFAKGLKSKVENSGVRLSAAGSFGRGLTKGSWSGAISDTKKTWNDDRPTLSKTHLQEWLASGSEEAQAKTHDLMQKSLEKQLEFVAKKLDVKLETYALLKAQQPAGNAPPAVADEAQELEHAQRLSEFMTELDHDLQNDEQLYRQISHTLDSLKEVNPDETSQSTTISHFVALQQGKFFDPDAEAPSLADSHAELAQYLLKDAPARYRDLRGKLLETELESTRLKTRFKTMATAATTEVPANAGSGNNGAMPIAAT